MIRTQLVLSGKKGRGTHEFHNVMDRVDIITGTLGKALGGASGGPLPQGKKKSLNGCVSARVRIFSRNSLGTIHCLGID